MIAKREVRNRLDNILRNFGIQTIRIYELNYLEEKYTETVSELVKLFEETVSTSPKTDKPIFLLKQLYGTSVGRALYLLDYLHKTMKLAGDICEFGCANGSTSALLGYEIKGSRKHLWLFDSFCGLSKPGKKDKLIDDILHLKSMNKYEGTMSYDESEVRSRLDKVNFPLERTHIVGGFIEDTLKENNLPKKICFAYMDFDLYSPTRATLNFLHKTLVTNGYVIIDDYNFFTLGVKAAVDEFIYQHKNEYQLILPKRFTGKICIIYRTK